jgi:predicted transcriptional regulator
MGHIPKKSLLVILRTVATLGGKPDKMAVHQTANIYKAVGGTLQRLDQLHGLELLNRQSTGKEFVYFVTPKGKQLLEQPIEGQMRALRKNEQREHMPKVCRVCGRQKGLVWWRKGYVCPMHLNDDTPVVYQIPYTSGLGWQ